MTEDENTGVALYNPDKSSPVELEFILLEGGTEVARRQLTLNPGQQLVDFVDGADLFGDFLASHSGEFKGTLNINASGQGKLAAIGLLQKRATGALIAISTSPNAFR